MDPKLLARYGSPEGAAAYRRKYERTWIRRLSNRREMGVVRRGLSAAGARDEILDCPCGAGRLVPVLLERAGRVVGADLSPAMVAEARSALAPLVAAGAVDLRVASADALPFPDRAFDTAVCHRLLHHVSERRDRVRILAELGRVARRGVVVSFQDATTGKGRRQARQGKQGRRVVLHPDELAAEAAEAGLLLVPPVHRLSPRFSLIAVAVLRKAPPPGQG